MQTLTRKKFVLYYHPDFAGGERTQIVGGEFFKEENGFRDYEIRDVKNINRDETINIGPLKVWRVK